MDCVIKLCPRNPIKRFLLKRKYYEEMNMVQFDGGYFKFRLNPERKLATADIVESFGKFMCYCSVITMEYRDGNRLLYCFWTNIKRNDILIIPYDISDETDPQIDNPIVIKIQ